jgi:hypothetical protein
MKITVSKNTGSRMEVVIEEKEDNKNDILDYIKKKITHLESLKDKASKENERMNKYYIGSLTKRIEDLKEICNIYDN